MARQPAKCCFCAPLRLGLLTWAYLKLILSLIGIGAWVYITRYDLRYFVDHINDVSSYRNPAMFILEQFWPLGGFLLYLVFSIILAVGVHHQNSKLLLVYLVYSIFEIIVAGVTLGWQLYHLLDMLSYKRQYDPEGYDRFLRFPITDPVFYLAWVLPILLNILLPIYFIVLIKSEVQYLKTRAVLDVPVTKEQNQTYNFVYSNGTSERRKPLFPVEELERLRQQLGVKNV